MRPFPSPLPPGRRRRFHRTLILMPNARGAPAGQPPPDQVHRAQTHGIAKQDGSAGRNAPALWGLLRCLRGQRCRSWRQLMAWKDPLGSELFGTSPAFRRPQGYKPVSSIAEKRCLTGQLGGSQLCTPLGGSTRPPNSARILVERVLRCQGNCRLGSHCKIFYRCKIFNCGSGSLANRAAGRELTCSPTSSLWYFCGRGPFRVRFGGRNGCLLVPGWGTPKSWNRPSCGAFFITNAHVQPDV
jgi:hypothetical protein